MYTLYIRPSLDEKLSKLAGRSRKQFTIIMKKTEEILQRPHHYKNLHAPLQHLKRVHIDKSFVLTFSIDEKRKTIILEDYDHHDKIYRG